MSRVKNADHDLLFLIIDDETDISDTCSLDAALLGANAVWVLYACAVCGDGGVPEGFIDE